MLLGVVLLFIGVGVAGVVLAGPGTGAGAVEAVPESARAVPASAAASAEAEAYRLDAEARERLAVLAREDTIYFGRLAPDVGAAWPDVQRGQALAAGADSLHRHMQRADRTEAALISALRTAAADGTITPAERAEVRAARDGADRAAEGLAEARHAYGEIWAWAVGAGG